MRDLKKPKVLEYLKANGSITSLQAFEKFKATRLSSIILRLRREGHHIITNMEEDKDSGACYARYVYKGVWKVEDGKEG